MNIAVFGTGMVGKSIATKLVQLGHHVMMGSRTKDNANAAEWAAELGSNATHGTYAAAAEFAEIVFNCTNGMGALPAVESARDYLGGKLLLDLTNPLDFSGGMPPTLFVYNDDSLGEQIQEALPTTRVVKTLNTVNADLMVNPQLLPEPTTMFMAGNDEAAKAQVRDILTGWFGWEDVVDFGGIENARGLESYLPFWIRLWGSLGTANFNIRIVKGD